MSWQLATFLIIGLVAVFFLSGLWTAFALGSAATIVVYLHGGSESLAALGDIAWNNNSSFVLTAVPLFILMGQLVIVGGMSAGFFRAVDYWMGRTSGGLLPGSIFACGVFGAPAGSSVATAAAVGSVALPAMTERGYKPGEAAGAIAAGGTLGILIPPSIPLIIYGATVSVSVGELFAGALLPGLILTAAFMVYVVVRTRLNPSLIGADADPVSWGEKFRSLPGTIPILVLVVVSIVPIYLGIATPTEAAALGTMAALIMAVKNMTVAKLVDALRGTVTTTVMVLAIVLGAQIISFALVDTGASREIAAVVADLGLSEIALIAALTVFYVILGDFLDGVSMMLLTLPVVFPVVMDAGIDPIVFGIIMVLFIELGQISPPIGLNLFVIHGLDPTIPHGSIMRAALPYCALMIVLVFLIAVFPELVTWLAQGSDTG